jgi:probable HAF family extracellular repeat protein
MMRTTLLGFSRIAGAVLAAGVLGICPLPALAQHYGIADLGTLPGGFTSDAFGVNHFGQVVGASTVTGGDIHAYYWDAGLIEIQPLLGKQCHAFDLNASGQVTELSYDIGELAVHGQIWQAGNYTVLGNIVPIGINTAGAVAGTVSLLDGTYGWVDHAAQWQNGNIVDLGTLGGHFSYAYAIADDGKVVGMSYTATEALRRATVWVGGVPLDLGTLGGTNSEARDINNNLQIAGTADTATGESHAALYTIDANGNIVTRRDLGVLGGGYSYGYGINDAGDVVGTSDASAFFWHAGTMTNLNTLVATGKQWHLDIARAINDRGQIAGMGLHHGQARAFLMTRYALADVNCDAAVNFADINPFVLALSGQPGYDAAYPECNWLTADCNNDGAVNFADINPFVQLLSGDAL